MLVIFQHPFIASPVFSLTNELCCISIRQYFDQGTLKDFICKVRYDLSLLLSTHASYVFFYPQAKPKAHFLKKYCSKKTYNICSIENTKLFGRQILEALTFLHEKGIPYGESGLHVAFRSRSLHSSILE